MLPTQRIADHATQNYSLSSRKDTKFGNPPTQAGVGLTISNIDYTVHSGQDFDKYWHRDEDVSTKDAKLYAYQ
jgi:hypothetical protein